MSAEVERQILCSGCLAVVPESQIHVIPCFNGDIGGYVATYRCGQCMPPALAETRARLAGMPDEAEIASACEMFERHGVFIHEFRRGDPPAALCKILDRMLGLIEAGAIRLRVGS